MTECDFQGEVIKVTAASVFFSWLSHSGEYQLPCREDTQEALWRGLCGEELSSPAKSHVTELFWKRIHHIASQDFR